MAITADMSGASPADIKLLNQMSNVWTPQSPQSRRIPLECTSTSTGCSRLRRLSVKLTNVLIREFAKLIQCIAS